MKTLLTAAVFIAVVAVASPRTAPTPKASPKTPAVEGAAASASNAFGLDLFRTLGKAKPDQNLFVSPYSMSIALTMTAEGARGQTRGEMSRVLHLPQGGQSMTPVHAGYAALGQRFREASGSADPKVRKQIDDLRHRLDEANRQAEENRNNYVTAREYSARAEKIASELNGLLPKVDRFDLRVANALWVERTFPIEPEYVKTVDRYYGTGEVTPLDIAHSAEQSRVRINRWVEERTERRITDLIPAGGLPPDTGMVLTNAVYFKGQWVTPFDERLTREENFKLAGAKTVRVRMMNDPARGGTPYAAFTGTGEYFETPLTVPQGPASNWPQTYPDDAGFSMIELPYKGGDLSMVLIAPRRADGLPALEARLTPAALDSWLRRLDRRTVNTTVPRFTMTDEKEMSNPLKAMGMKRAFNNPTRLDGAEFGGISASGRLSIGVVRHKAWLAVDEKGTEAAAATAVQMRLATSAAPSRLVSFVPVFRADRPFVFLIRDTKSGVILFIGRMTNPAA